MKRLNPVYALMTAIIAVALAAPLAFAQDLPSGKGRVIGRIIGNPEKGGFKGATVILLRFQLDEQGKPTGGPVGRVEAGEGGTYEFTNLPLDAKAVFRLGTRIDGNLVSSSVFALSESNPVATMDLVIPEVSQNLEVLGLTQALVAIETRENGLFITEVLHLRNPAPNVLDATGKPLEVMIPADAGHFEMLRLEGGEARHEVAGETLRIFTQLKPGENTIAFRYFLGATLGKLSLTKVYPMNADTVMVLSPQGGLEIQGAGLKQMDSRNIEGQMFNTWSLSAHAAGSPLVIYISGLPIAQWVFLVAMSGLLVLLVGVVVWFILVRQKRPAKA